MDAGTIVPTKIWVSKRIFTSTRTSIDIIGLRVYSFKVWVFWKLFAEMMLLLAKVVIWQGCFPIDILKNQETRWYSDNTRSWLYNYSDLCFVTNTCWYLPILSRWWHGGLDGGHSGEVCIFVIQEQNNVNECRIYYLWQLHQKSGYVYPVIILAQTVMLWPWTPS